MTHRIDDLSMPIPNARVAQIMGVLSKVKASWMSLRSEGESPA